MAVTTQSNIEAIFPFITNLMVGDSKVTLTTKFIPKGTFIYHEGDPCSSIAFIVKGVIRVSKTGTSGREMTLYRVTRGESCILSISSTLSEIPYPATAFTEKDSVALLVSVSQFQKWLATNLILQNFIYKLLSTRLLSVLTIIDDVVFRKMDERVIELLLKKNNESNQIEMTHEEISMELGTAREVVSRIMKLLEKEGLVELSRGKILIVDVKQLEGKLPNA